MSIFSDIIEEVAPWLGAAITGGPVGLATLAAGKIAEAIGLGDSSIKAVTAALSAGNLTPEQKLALQNSEQDFKSRMVELGFQHEKDMVLADVSALIAVNATMQAEANNNANEEWYQKAWRPLNGFCVAIGSFVGVVASCVLFAFGIYAKDPNAISAIPQLAASLSMILAIPGAAVGITAWHRGKLQREEITK